MKTQAWGWLVAAVLAAGLNASYYDGGLEWAHRIASSVEHSSNAVLALATGHADRFLAEAQVLAARQETASCPLSAALARVQSRIAQAQAKIARAGVDADRLDDSFEVMSAREEAEMARIEADGARIEAEVSRMRIPDADFAPAMVSMHRVACPRVRFTMPAMPRIKMPATPVIHINAPSAGPV